MVASKGLAILGSTGSIGRQTLDIVRHFPERFRVVGLAAGGNLELLSAQVAEFKPDFICYSNEGSAGVGISWDGCKFISMEDMAQHTAVDMVVIATSGIAGLRPTLAAVEAGKKIALANKESLVAAGEIITAEAKRTGATILPVDSEHSAIWQCLMGETQAAGLILTASGGPFRNCSLPEMEMVTVEQALKHPSWQMGKKVTIDSATLMNKGLEVIEAHWLFSMPFDNIKVLVHPQSIVHSIVEFVDGSFKAQLSYPDMRIPIQYALSYPERLPNSELPRLDWREACKMVFEPPDLERFPCLRLAVGAGKEGGTCPAVLCAADEVAVELFLSKRIGFTDIARLVEQVLKAHRTVCHPRINEILAAERWARETVLRLVEGEN